MHLVGEDARREAEDEHRCDERRDGHDLAAVHVREALVLVAGDRAEEHLLDRTEHVERSEDDAERRADGLDAGDVTELVGREGARDDEELADEPVQAGDADARHRRDDEERGVDRHRLRETAKVVEHARVAAVVDDADEEEERAGRDAVVDHLEEGTFDGSLRPSEEAEHHVAEVRDRRVRDEALHVILTPRAERAVEDAAEDGDAAERCGELSGGLGEEPHAEPEVPVRAHLEHDGREDDRARRRRLGVRVGQPGVHRPHRNLHEEGDREAGPQPELDVTRELEALELEEVERRVAAGDAAVRVREVQDGGEHQEAAGHRVEEELERRLDAVRAAPDPDHHVHRDQHDLPEDVEHEQVEGDEGADHARLEEEESEAPVLDALVDAPEGRVGGDRGAEQRQDDEPERDAVERDVPVDAEALNPHHVVVEVEAPAHVDAQKRDRREQRAEHDDQRRRLEEAGRLARHEEDRDGTCEREADEPREERGHLLGRRAGFGRRDDGRRARPHPRYEDREEAGHQRDRSADAPGVTLRDQPGHHRRDDERERRSDRGVRRAERRHVLVRNAAEELRGNDGEDDEPEEDEQGRRPRGAAGRGRQRRSCGLGGHDSAHCSLIWTVPAPLIGDAGRVMV